MNQWDPGLAPSRSSGGSRAANADGAPRKHAAFHSSRAPDRKAPRRSLSRLMWPGRISGDGDAPADIPCHHAAGANHRAVADRDAGQDDGPAADPDITADPDRSSEFEAAAARFSVARVVGGIDLRRRSNLGAIADADLRDIQNHAIEVQE